MRTQALLLLGLVVGGSTITAARAHLVHQGHHAHPVDHLVHHEMIDGCDLAWTEPKFAACIVAAKAAEQEARNRDDDAMIARIKAEVDSDPDVELRSEIARAQVDADIAADAADIQDAAASDAHNYAVRQLYLPNPDYRSIYTHH